MRVRGGSYGVTGQSHAATQWDIQHQKRPGYTRPHNSCRSGRSLTTPVQPQGYLKTTTLPFNLSMLLHLDTTLARMKSICFQDHKGAARITDNTRHNPSLPTAISPDPFLFPPKYVYRYISELFICSLDIRLPLTRRHPRLDELLESAVDGRPDVGHILPEVDGGDRALGNALGGELELLLEADRLAGESIDCTQTGGNLPCTHRGTGPTRRSGSGRTARAYTSPSPWCS